MSKKIMRGLGEVSHTDDAPVLMTYHSLRSNRSLGRLRYPVRSRLAAGCRWSGLLRRRPWWVCGVEKDGVGRGDIVACLRGQLVRERSVFGGRRSQT